MAVNISDTLLRKMIISRRKPMFLFVIILVQFLLKLTFICPCCPTPIILTLYMLLPSLILFHIVILKDRQFMKSIRLCDNICNSAFMNCLLKGVIFSAMWVIITLFDGDWYACYKTSSQHKPEIPCMDKRNASVEAIFREHKANSQIIGFGIFCSIFLFHLVGICTSAACYRLKSCCYECCACCECCTPKIDNVFYKLKYDKYLETATHKHLKETMKDIAEQKAQLICEEPLREIRVMELNQYSMEAETIAAFDAARATVTAALKVAARATEAAGPVEIAGQEHGEEPAPAQAATAKAWEAAAAERGKRVAIAAAEVAEAAVTVAVAAAETLHLGKKDQTHVDAAQNKAKHAAEQVKVAKKLMTSVTVAAIMAASAAAKGSAPPASAPAKAAEAAQKLAAAAQAAVSAAEQAAARAAAMANATAAMAGVALPPKSGSSEGEEIELLKLEHLVQRVEDVAEAEKTKWDPWIYVSKPNCHLMMK